MGLRGNLDKDTNLTTPISVANGGTGTTGITGVVCGTGSVYNGRQIQAGVGISIVDGDGVSGNPVITATGGGLGFIEVVTTVVVLTVNTVHLLNAGSLLTATLPTVSSTGDIIKIIGKGSSGWEVDQNASQIIHFGTSDTTTGVTGNLESTEQYDSFEMTCTVTNLEWTVTASLGNITVN